MRNSFAIAALLSVAPSLAFAAGDWSVDPDGSAIHYVSTKKEHVAENHVIDALTGALSSDGALTVEIGMDSVNSGIEVRDNRMRDMLYRVTDFPTASFTAEIDVDEFSDMEVGETLDSYIDGILTLVGVETEIDFAVQVTRSSDDTVVVVSDGPIIMDATTLELTDGVDQLREAAGLPSISYGVPVYVRMSFVQG